VGGKKIAGRWVVDTRARVVCRDNVRLLFRPVAPLSPGVYEISGLPRAIGLGRFNGTKRRVTVGPKRDTRRPVFTGLRSARCQRPNPLLGCRPFGIVLEPGWVQDASKTRFVTHIRSRGKPYSAAAKIEAAYLPYAAQKIAGTRKAGRYILTLRALDRSDNVAQRICEVELTLPVARGCKGFSKVERARCARWDRKRKAWISAIDSVALRFD
jgi:hypothetical protein